MLSLILITLAGGAAAQGDCDTDDDCKGCLKCFKRSNGEPVPGCSGDVFDPRLDFCYAP